MSKVVAIIGVLSALSIIRSEVTAQKMPERKEVELPNGVTITMIWVKPGRFLMGSPSDELERDETLEKQHEVRITKGFWLAETEFTQGDWEKIMKNNPSRGKGANLPVENVSWSDVMDLLKKINKKGGTFRLPTEAEWEYTCRAGTTGPYPGNRDNTTWHAGNSGRSSQPVATRLPNPWGFYDMNGNILEWCSDWFQEDNTSGSIDPKGPDHGVYKVQRGGQFTGRIRHTRAADRQRGAPGSYYFFAGFRLAASKLP